MTGHERRSVVKRRVVKPGLPRDGVHPVGDRSFDPAVAGDGKQFVLLGAARCNQAGGRIFGATHRVVPAGGRAVDRISSKR